MDAIITNPLIIDPQPAEKNPAMLYLARLNARSGRYTQASVIKMIAEWLGGTVETIAWGELKYEAVNILTTKIAEMNFSPAYRKKFHSAIRGILENAMSMGQMSVEDYTHAAKLKKIKGEKLPAGRYIPTEEIARLFRACAADPIPAASARDQALLAVMFFCGPRRAEVANMDLTTYNETTGELQFVGKGQKERLGFIVNRGLALMTHWLDLRGREPGPLFLAVGKTGTIRTGKRMSAQAVYNIIEKRIKQAGLENITPHDFRRTSISNQLDAGTDLTLVASMYGQVPQTTAKYDRRPLSNMRMAAQKVDLPG